MMVEQVDEIAVVGWPRSGTTWISNCLSECLGYQWHGYEKESVAFREPGVVIRSHYKPQEIDLSSKVILVVRDPRSVVISHFFMLKRYAETWTGSIAEYVTKLLGHGGRYDLPAGGWSSFYDTWLDSKRVGMLVRHEDAMRDRTTEMLKLCAWVGIERSESRIASTCKKWIVSTRMTYDGNAKSIAAGSEVWQQFLSPENERAIFEQAGATMSRLGYL